MVDYLRSRGRAVISKQNQLDFARCVLSPVTVYVHHCLVLIVHGCYPLWVNHCLVLIVHGHYPFVGECL